MNARTIDTLLEKLDKWCQREIAAAKGNEQKMESIMDRFETIEMLCQELPENSRTIKTLLDTIDLIFEDKANAVTLCTIHKSKGLEADRVWWLNRSECPSTWVRKDWQFQQEINICYVATTRAKSALYLIEL